jgi:hypothetical protein
VLEVGRGSGVTVGGEVGLGSSVGGTRVAVGRACSVSATMVKAAASAVCWISRGSAVGVARGPQALASSIKITPKSVRDRFITESLSMD